MEGQGIGKGRRDKGAGDWWDYVPKLAGMTVTAEA